MFYATIVWSVGYWVVYPAWPLISELYHRPASTTRPRAEVAVELADLDKVRGDKMATLAAARSPRSRRIRRCWRSRARAARRRSATIARPATARGGAGAKGYPNLNDDDWLWGGTLDEIEQTIQFGARSGHAKAHEGSMLAFGKDGILKRDEIVTVANYVRSLSGLSTRRDLTRRRQEDLRRQLRRPATATPARATRSSARPT